MTSRYTLKRRKNVYVRIVQQNWRTEHRLVCLPETITHVWIATQRDRLKEYTAIDRLFLEVNGPIDELGVHTVLDVTMVAWLGDEDNGRVGCQRHRGTWWLWLEGKMGEIRKLLDPDPGETVYIRESLVFRLTPSLCSREKSPPSLHHTTLETQSSQPCRDSPCRSYRTRTPACPRQASRSTFGRALLQSSLES